MSIEKYSNKEIEYVVNSFKSFMKVVAKNAAIDYNRKLKSCKFKMISLNNILENEKSLSREDSGFFYYENKIGADYSNVFSNPKYERAFKRLTKNEQKVLVLYSKDITLTDISRITRLKKDNILKIRNRAIHKFKNIVKEDYDEN